MVECLAEVIIDLNTETVRCIWVDEAIDEWQLASNVNQEQYEECLRQLQSVLHDVDTSGEEAERERMREEWEVRYHAMAQAHAEAQQAYANAQTQAALTAAASPPVKPTKHKKQRSIVPSLSPSTPSHSLPLVSEHHRLECPGPPPPAAFQPPPPPPPAPHPSKSSRHLRRRARSTLVDVWRRYILGELRARVSPYPCPNLSGLHSLALPSQHAGPVSYEPRNYTYGGLQSGGAGGYHPWVARSMLKRAEAHMAWLVHENGGVVPEVAILDEIDKMHRPKRAQRVPSNNPFFDDEDDEDNWGHDGLEQEDAKSLLTDTDGSSVHTPSESPFPTFPQGPMDCAKPLPRNIDLLRTYKVLTTHALQLSSHIARLSALNGRARTEEVRALAIQEVKARRRAWSNRALLGGSRAGPASGGCGSVFRSSPLRWGCFTAEDLEAGRWEDGWEEDSGDATVTDISLPASITSGRLFPVSEENENEDDGGDAFPLGHHNDPQLDSDSYDVDLEAGLMNMDLSDLAVPVAPAPVRNHMRSRTRSMYAPRPTPLILQQLPAASIPQVWAEDVPSRPTITRSCEDLSVIDFASSRRGVDELRDEERRRRERALFEFDYEHDSESGSNILSEMGIEDWEEDVDLARMKGVEGAVLKSSPGGKALTLVEGEWLPSVVIDCQ
ncbi:hypothetical protein HWV62_17172 [Athelia sp. TMB]|nr:hypothetical protein HWV62_17172 [Athelia sp. TMB]